MPLGQAGLPGQVETPMFETLGEIVEINIAEALVMGTGLRSKGPCVRSFFDIEGELAPDAAEKLGLQP